MHIYIYRGREGEILGCITCGNEWTTTEPNKLGSSFRCAMTSLWYLTLPWVIFFWTVTHWLCSQASLEGQLPFQHHRT